MLYFNNVYNFQKIGTRIREARTNASLTQEDLGNQVGVSRWTVAGWEKGEKMPEMAVMLNLCNLFGCELGYLLCEHDTKTRQAADICAETGLSEASVDILVSAQKEVIRKKEYHEIDILSENLTLDEFSESRIKPLFEDIEYNKMAIRFIDAFINSFSVEKKEASLMEHLWRYILILKQKDIIWGKDYFEPLIKLYRICTRSSYYADNFQIVFIRLLLNEIHQRAFTFQQYEILFRAFDSVILQSLNTICYGCLGEEKEILLSNARGETNKKLRSLDAEFPEVPPNDAPFRPTLFYLKPYLEIVKSPQTFLDKVTRDAGKQFFLVLKNIDKLKYYQFIVTESFDDIVKRTFEKEG